jgi:hypothetical protein
MVPEVGCRCPDQKIATIDRDTTIIESSKREALPTYPGIRGKPMLALWRISSPRIWQFLSCPPKYFPGHQNEGRDSCKQTTASTPSVLTENKWLTHLFPEE